jgi:hypothetical protein
MVWVSYDSGLAYPQPALFGKGVGHADGTHTPPAGLSSFSVDESVLIHGKNEDYYEVTAADTLTPKSQSIVDADLLEEHKEKTKDRVKTDAQNHLESLYPLRDQVHISMGAISLAKYDELKADIIALRSIVTTAYADITSAVDIAAVDAVYAGITYPTLPTI